MLKRPSKQDYVSAEHYASALQIYIDVKESALQSQIDRLTKERDQLQLLLVEYRDELRAENERLRGALTDARKTMCELADIRLCSTNVCMALNVGIRKIEQALAHNDAKE